MERSLKPRLGLVEGKSCGLKSRDLRDAACSPSAFITHAAPSRGQITAARFSPDGNRIFAGTSKGAVLVFDTWTRQLLADVKVSGASSVRELAFDRTGRYVMISWLLVLRIIAFCLVADRGLIQLICFLFCPSRRNLVANSNDRAIRVFGVETRTVSPPTQTEDETDEDSPSSAAAANDTLTQKPRVKVDLNLHHKFQDLVNRTPWNGIGFSGDAEYVMGGECAVLSARGTTSLETSVWQRGLAYIMTAYADLAIRMHRIGAAHKAAHNIYIWDRGAGALVKILEGPREPLVDVDVRITPSLPPLLIQGKTHQC